MNTLVEVINRHTQGFNFLGEEARAKAAEILSHPISEDEKKDVYKALSDFALLYLTRQISQ